MKTYLRIIETRIRFVDQVEMSLFTGDVKKDKKHYEDSFGITPRYFILKEVKK